MVPAAAGRRAPAGICATRAGIGNQCFCRRYQRRKVRIALPFLERDGDAVHNSVVLISPEGVIDGKYHKVRLADGREVESGIRPGDTLSRCFKLKSDAWDAISAWTALPPSRPGWSG